MNTRLHYALISLAIIPGYSLAFEPLNTDDAGTVKKDGNQVEIYSFTTNQHDSNALNAVDLPIPGQDYAGNYLLGNTTASTTASITQAPLTVSALGTNKQYDTTRTDTVTLASNQLSGDVLILGNSAATFADKNVGTNKSVAVSGITVTGTDAGNYLLGNTTASTTANITQAPLTVSALGTNKQYDGSTLDTVSLSSNALPGDVVIPHNLSANFLDPFVGNNKIVNVLGISITGIDAANYTANSSAAITANITAVNPTPDPIAPSVKTVIPIIAVVPIIQGIPPLATEEGVLSTQPLSDPSTLQSLFPPPLVIPVLAPKQGRN